MPNGAVKKHEIGYHLRIVRRIALAAGSVFAAVVVTAAPAAPPPPVVSISTMQPLVVTGAHFFPREWVRVTVNTSTARVHANRVGRFSITFPNLTSAGAAAS